MTQSDIVDRLDELEAQLDDQQETIEHQQERIDQQAETIESQQARLEEQDAIIQSQRERLEEEGTPASESEPAEQELPEPETTDENSEVPGPIATRRGVLTAGSVLGLLGLGAGTASADAQGQIGTSKDPLQDLYTANLHGDSGTVAVNDDIDLTDNQINYGTNAGSQTLANLPFGSSQREGSTNSYAMQLDGDDVLTINGVNDGDGNLNNAYVWANKELRLSGTLDTRGGTIENTTGGLTVTTNDNGNLTLDPGANNEVDVTSGGLDLNGKPLKSSSYGNVWDLRTSSNIGSGGARTFSLEINDDGSSDNDITWQRAGNEDAAFRVIDRTNDNNLLTVTDGGDVDVHNGNLDLNGNNVETSTGDLKLDPAGSAKITSQPSESGDIISWREGVESGTEVIDGLSGGGGDDTWNTSNKKTISVTFDNSFNQKPVVSATIDDTSAVTADEFKVSVQNIAKGGFDLVVYQMADVDRSGSDYAVLYVATTGRPSGGNI